jgi:hypothetical protein
MITFTKPINLNGSELLAELNAGQVTITELPQIDGNGVLWLDVKETDKTKAEKIVALHDGTIIPPESTIDEKLASVGLSIDDLKVALGI